MVWDLFFAYYLFLEGPMAVGKVGSTLQSLEHSVTTVSKHNLKKMNTKINPGAFLAQYYLETI